MEEFCEKAPNHLTTVVVFILALMAVSFMMWKKQPVRVEIEESNRIKLRIAERKK